MTIKQPKSVTITAKTKDGTITGEVIWSKSFGPVFTANFKKAQTWVDNEVVRLCDPLTPKRNGKLIDSALPATKFGSGLIQYNSPYARYHYYGKLMVGRAPKKLTNINMTYQGAPNRGAKWFERMKASNKKQLLKGAGKIARGSY